MSCPVKSHAHPPSQNGFSLVEIMVGMVIGLLGMVVVFQVFSVSEAQKRTTTGGSDAQTSGNIALFSIEREMRMGGYGFANTSLLNCQIQSYDNTRPAPGTFSLSFIPVEITQGAAGAPDTVSVIYGSAPILGNNDPTFTLPGGNPAVYQMEDPSRRTGFDIGHLVVAAGTGGTYACALAEVTDIPGNSSNITHTPGQGRYNKSPAIAGPTSGTLYDLGSLPRNAQFSIQNGERLVVQDNIRYIDADANGVNDTLELADGIVNLQAQYGADTNNDGVVSPNEYTDAAPADWTKLRAVRIAILARSGQFEKNPVTAVAPSWAGGAFTMANPADGTDWRNYRYRVYETVVPLRNMIWRTP